MRNRTESLPAVLWNEPNVGSLVVALGGEVLSLERLADWLAQARLTGPDQLEISGPCLFSFDVDRGVAGDEIAIRPSNRPALRFRVGSKSR